MGDNEQRRGTLEHPLCHWHDEDIRAMKEESRELENSVRSLSGRIPDHFGETFAVLASDVTRIKLALETQFVTKSEFDPVKRIVYGLAGLILLGAGGAVVRLILR